MVIWTAVTCVNATPTWYSIGLAVPGSADTTVSLVAVRLAWCAPLPLTLSAFFVWCSA